MGTGIKMLSIQKICIAYLIVWTISPPLSIDLSYRIVALVSVLIFLLVELSKTELLLSKIEIYSLFFLLLVIAVSLINGDVLRSISIYMLIIAFFMYCRYDDNFEELEGLQLLALVLLIVWNIKTYSALQIDDHIAREIVRNDENTYQYLRQGVGGYGHIICQTIISPVIFSWTLSARHKHKLCFIIGFVCFVSFFLVLSVATYAIPLLATIIGVIIYFIGKGEKVWVLIVVSAIIAVAVVFLIGYVKEIREWLMDLFPSNTAQNKINDLMASINSGELQGDFDVRFRRYIAPVEAFFFRYPLIGGLWNGGAGGHSSILDAFGRYGIFGGWITCKLMFMVPNSVRSKFFDNVKMRRTTAALSTVLFVSMLLDSWTISCSLLLFIVVPLMMENIHKWETEKEIDKNPIVVNPNRVH